MLPEQFLERMRCMLGEEYDIFLETFAQWLAYIGLALIFLFAAKISGVICVLLIIAAFIAKSRYWLAIAAYFIALPIAFSLRYICYNKWTLICSAVLFLGFLL